MIVHWLDSTLVALNMATNLVDWFFGPTQQHSGYSCLCTSELTPVGSWDHRGCRKSNPGPPQDSCMQGKSLQLCYLSDPYLLFFFLIIVLYALSTNNFRSKDRLKTSSNLLTQLSFMLRTLLLTLL